MGQERFAQLKALSNCIVKRNVYDVSNIVTNLKEKLEAAQTGCAAPSPPLDSQVVSSVEEIKN